jgi:streptomycin 6-kinase
MQSIPEAFVRTTLQLYGERGATWLQGLPLLLVECERRWSVAVLPPFANLSYNYVAPAVRSDGMPVVVKAGVPNPDLMTEIEALRFYDGRGMVQLLDADPEQGILLLERLQPGAPLSTLPDDEQATIIAAQVMQQLWQPAPAVHNLPTVARWTSGLKRLRRHYDGGTGPIPAHMVDLAENLFAALVPSSAEPVLLHGDLHHDNILAAQRAPWLAMDPKGLIGEPAYETGALLRNPIQHLPYWPDQARIQARRVDLLAELLDCDRQRLIGWGVAQAVLSAWWDIADHISGWEPVIACAEHLATLLS